MNDLTPDQEIEFANILTEGNVLGELETVIRDAASELLEAGAVDLSTFATRLSAQLVYAQASGNDEIRASVERQARLLAEIQRLRFTDAAWDVFYSVAIQSTAIVVRVATNLLLAGATRIAL